MPMAQDTGSGDETWHVLCGTGSRTWIVTEQRKELRSTLGGTPGRWVQPSWGISAVGDLGYQRLSDG